MTQRIVASAATIRVDSDGGADGMVRSASPRTLANFGEVEMKTSLVAMAMLSLGLAPVTARAFMVTSGQPVGPDISLAACAITNASNGTLVIDGIDFIDAGGSSCSASETSGCGSSNGGPLPAGGTVQLMCNTPTAAPPTGCGSSVRCQLQAHGVSPKNVRVVVTYTTTAGPIVTLPAY
jgi:hypothetical protein